MRNARAQFNAGVEKRSRREKPGQISHVIRGTGVISASLVPRPPPSSVRNARAQFNAGVEKRREGSSTCSSGAEKAWTNFTRDPRHRRHKCLTRTSVTYSVLAMRVYVQLETSSQRISSLSGRRERGESRARNSTGNSAELRD